MSSFCNKKELRSIGLKSVGNNCFISKYARFYHPELIEIGNNVRIDDFCILSGDIKLGSFIHISAYVALYGAYGIQINNFCGLSPRSTIFSASDDFSGDFLTNPMIPHKYTNVSGGPVCLKKYVQLGANTVVMPNVTVGEGTVTGAFTFINRNLSSWKIYIGIPAKVYKQRSKSLLKYIPELLDIQKD
ncbi:MAG: acyltransferase [Bacteroidales bacterium]